MRRLAIRVGIALAMLMTVTGTMLAQDHPEPDRLAVIHVTRNFGTKYPAECLVTVATEDLPSRRQESVMWIIRNGNAQDERDACPNVDKTKVTLKFEDDVMGAAAMKELKPGLTSVTYHGKSVFVIDGMIDKGTPPMSTHKYTTYYKDQKAGPDPEIEVDCPNCGPGPGH